MVHNALLSNDLTNNSQLGTDIAYTFIRKICNELIFTEAKDLSKMSTKKITYQKTLRWRIVIVLLAVSFLPLIVAGIGGWIVFGNLLEQKALDQMRTLVQGHGKAIESTLSNRIHLLQLLAETNSLDILKDSGRLQALLADLNQFSDGGFIDLGIIDANGNHLAYVGPYRLLDKNYSEADWFKEVMRKGAYVSDVFLGFREVPHCVIAVKSNKGNDAWILRATINGQQFDELVKTGVSVKTSFWKKPLCQFLVIIPGSKING